MKFNDTSNKEESIIHDISFWTGTDTSTFTMEERTRSVNEWYRVVNKEIWQSSSFWQFDDSRYSTLPIAEADLSDSATNMEMPSSAQSVEHAEIKDKDGNWRQAQIMDRSQVDMSFSEWRDEKGFPDAIHLLGRSMYFKPPVDGEQVTTTSGIRLWLARGISTFSTSDTTTEPGFDEDLHRILSLGASHDWIIAREGSNSNRVNAIQGKLNTYLQKLREFYGQRNKSANTRIIPSRTDTV